MTALFYFFVTVALLAALGILFSKNVFKSALLLIACLLSIAAIFVLLFAEFVAVTQILVYAGGVTVLIIFGIMLSTSLNGKPLTVGHSNLFSGIVLGISLATLIIAGVMSMPVPDANDNPVMDAKTVGKLLIGQFAIPFELSGILLLIALVGASVATAFLKDKRSA